ncbi:hypothetical protein PI124_g15486 [Phytophthora idaei]|nr:hypothetical protein PI125_g16926 [Phytophthora idaei]KAG3143515.1 hypothetical protein PI126_g14587 [Phytophthora idaei]KAG3239588.1 hypothetical protein PI124_g15486 [Phytophthora idaei]
MAGNGEGATTAVAASTGAQHDEPSGARVSPSTDPRRTSARRTPPSTLSPNVRVSPYPLRERTPPQSASPPAPPTRQRARVSLDASPLNAEQHRLQLVVQPIVKDTVGKRDASGRVLEDYATNGATFSDIMHKLWEKFSCNVKGKATKQDDTWSIERPSESAWCRVMQFKWNRRLVPTTKTEQAWNRWVASLRGETVTLMIYEYGLGIPNARALEEFLAACIRPEHTDRSRGAAEVSLREVVERLLDSWGATYQGSAVVWRMWANYIIRNLNRSTWDAAVLDPPTPRVERLLRAADSQIEQHLSGLTRSARLALDCVNASMADNEQLKKDWEAFGRRLVNQQQTLAERKEIIEGFLDDIPLPPVTEEIDPLPRMENAEDTEHNE